MRKFCVKIALATLAVASIAPAAEAAPWQSINARQSRLFHRIDMGVRNGGLTRAEASRLRQRYWSLARLESRYRRGGLNGWERSDLNRRFDRLSRSIRVQRHDWQRRRWR